MPEKRVVKFNQDNKPHGGKSWGKKGKKKKHKSMHGGSGRQRTDSLRYTLPNYLAKRKRELDNAAPGHKFLLYFQGAAASQDGDGFKPASWQPLDTKKKEALQTVAQPFSPDVKRGLNALVERQTILADMTSNTVMRYHARLTAPVAIGLGNPHPVENGFSFLSPYGLPYFPGSGVKGAIRSSAEELALFDEESKWTIPLVWVLFGFEAGSGYLMSREQQQFRGHEMADAFGRWIEQDASEDRVLKWWLQKIKDQLPGQLRELTRDQVGFCERLQDGSDVGKSLRNAISWKGLLRFWDVFPEIDSMAVDILNPHHKEYYEGKHGPIETEAPQPVFFLTIPAQAEVTITIEMDGRVNELLDVPEVDSLLEEAVSNCVEWIGFGGKTSSGYGVGEIDHAARQKEEEERKKRIAEEQRRLARLKALEEEKRKEAEAKARLEAKLANLPEDLAWIERKSNEEDWNVNSVLLAGLESFFETFSEPGSEALEEVASWLEKKWPGIMKDPDAVRGKKKRPKYKERPRNLAKKVIELKGHEG